MLAPFRGEGEACKPKPVDFKKLFAAVPVASSRHAPDYKPRASLVELAQTGRGSLADEADAVIIIGSSGPKRGEFTTVSGSDTVKVVSPAVDRWIATYGAADAVEIALLVGRWKPYDLLTTGYTVRAALARLRQWLAHSADYEAARTRATELATKLDRSKYNADAERLSHLFPDDRSLFESAARQLVHREWVSSLLLGSVTTVAEMTSIAGRIGVGDWTAHATVLARSLGEASIPFLAAYSRETVKIVEVAEALAGFPTRAAAEALALYADQKPARKILAPYFTEHPALASVLTPKQAAAFTAGPSRP